MAEPDEPSFDDRFANNLPDYVSLTPVDDPWERAAQRIRAPYEKANQRVSGLPDVLTVIGNRVQSGLTAPRDALTGQLQVNDPETNMPTPQAIGRAADVAGLATVGGMPAAEPGALGMGGGKLLNRNYLTKDQMLARGADGHLDKAVEAMVPVEKVTGREPTPAASEDNPYVKGKPITQPIEVAYDKLNDTYTLYAGNHRITQAELNGDKYIPAFVQPDGGKLGLQHLKNTKLNASGLPVTFTPVDGDPHKPTVGNAIETAAAKYGLNPVVLKGIASIESSWDPESNRKRKDTQYKGLFQIGYDEWKKYGKGDIYNAQDNADAAAHMLRDHSDWFKDSYGNEPNPGELYMMHQQGRGHFTRGALTNVAGNPYPGMRGPQTPESFRQGWTNELERRMARYGGADSISDGTQYVARDNSAPTKVASNDKNFMPTATHKFTPVDHDPFELVNHANHVPYGAGASDTPSGYPVNIDKRIPQYNTELKMPDGEPADLHKYLTIHEIEEYKAMKNGVPYHKAHHDIATPMEKKAVESDGVDWKKYTHIMDGYLKKTEEEGHTDLPKGLYAKPYHSRSLIKPEPKTEKGTKNA